MTAVIHYHSLQCVLRSLLLSFSSPSRFCDGFAQGCRNIVLVGQVSPELSPDSAGALGQLPWGQWNFHCQWFSLTNFLDCTLHFCFGYHFQILASHSILSAVVLRVVFPSVLPLFHWQNRLQLPALASFAACIFSISQLYGAMELSAQFCLLHGFPLHVGAGQASRYGLVLNRLLPFTHSLCHGFACLFSALGFTRSLIFVENFLA